jgi:hypothetical protein
METVRERYCFVVIKGGKLVHETYFTNSSETKYETDSLGKTMIAEVVGAIHAKYNFSLDEPISNFGVDTSDFNQFAPNVTMRHLLSQTTGIGQVEPGAYFTYDSDDYIQHIAPALGKILGDDNPLMDWAEEHYAKPMGFPGVFKENDMYLYPNISIGGGQHMTCREIARVGQLLLNKGRWPASSADGAVMTQLLRPSFVADLERQNFPAWGTSYGFLTWLNRPGAHPTYCCAPRWCNGPAIGQADKMLMSGIVGDDIAHPFEFKGYRGGGGGPPPPQGPVVSAPEDTLLAYGWLARVMMVIPSLDTVVVSMGQTVGQSQTLGECDYDEGYSITKLWEAIRDAVTEETPPDRRSADASGGGARADAVAQEQEQAQGKEQQKGEPVAEGAAQETAAASAAPVVVDDGSHHRDGVIAGSCFLYCPPNEGYGHCFDISSTHQPPLPAPVPGQCQLHGVTANAGATIAPRPDCDWSRAWDGDVFSYYDLSQPNGGWTQAAIAGQPRSLSRIDYYPRANFLERSRGGRFMGILASATGGGDGDGEMVELARITTMPTLGWNPLNVSGSVGGWSGRAPEVSAVRYVAADGSYGNIGEILLFSADCSAEPPAASSAAAAVAAGGGVSNRGVVAVGSGVGYVPQECQALAYRAGDFCPQVSHRD